MSLFSDQTLFYFFFPHASLQQFLDHDQLESVGLMTMTRHRTILAQWTEWGARMESYLHNQQRHIQDLEVQNLNMTEWLRASTQEAMMRNVEIEGKCCFPSNVGLDVVCVKSVWIVMSFFFFSLSFKDTFSCLKANIGKSRPSGRYPVAVLMRGCPPHIR